MQNSDISTLKVATNTKTANLVLLSIATAGIYPIIWISENHKKIDAITKSKTADSVYIIWMAVTLGLGGALSYTGDDLIDLIGAILSLAAGVLYIIWAFRARTALQSYALNEYKMDLPMNKFYTFIFNLYYINYVINDLPNVYQKSRIISGQINQQ